MDSKLLLIIATLALAATTMYSVNNESTDFVSKFENYKTTFGKTYDSPEEEAYRYAVYIKNVQEINEHNADNTQTYKKGINQFTDLTIEEFVSKHLTTLEENVLSDMQVFESETFNGSVDWTAQGKVQHVKNQGQCGSCWAFSTMGSVESASAIFGSELPDLAEQQLVDCSGSYGPQGCGGGWPYTALEYLRDNGSCYTSSYPYTAQDGTCKASSCSKSSYKVNGYSQVSRGSVSSLNAACDKQPVSIVVDATQFGSYSSGVFSNCGTTAQDHAILLTGYTDEYWKIKNSWGASWGEEGYIRFVGGANTCGLINNAVVPT